MKNVLLIVILVAMVAGGGCTNSNQDQPGSAAGTSSQPPVMFLNITSSAADDPHAVTMALQLAGHALDDGRDVVLFFNVRGVDVPTIDLPEDIAFGDRPIRELLIELLDRGAEVQVCPHCMKAMDIEETDLIPGAVVTDRARLFGKLGPNTAVFSY
jgi:predicted peroxiredoxin